MRSAPLSPGSRTSWRRWPLDLALWVLLPAMAGGCPAPGARAPFAPPGATAAGAPAAPLSTAPVPSAATPLPSAASSAPSTSPSGATGSCAAPTPGAPSTVAIGQAEAGRRDASRPSDGRLPQSEAEWRARLTPQQYRVLREGGTERAFTGPYWNEHGQGTYRCRACGLELFSSSQKYDSGSGWPSFWAPVSPERVELKDHSAEGDDRVEVRCPRCKSHLGHVFDDGPRPTGKRFCINGIALDKVD